MKKIITTLFLAAVLGSTVYAQTGTFNIETGTWTSGSSSNCSWNGTVLTVNNDADIIVTGSVSGGRRIEVAANATATITLSTISITNPGNAAILLNNGAVLTLTMADGTENTLTGSDNYAGICTTDATLEITGTGKLTTRGGSKGAGIGGSNNGDGGTINIYDGMIEAYGGEYGLGFGGAGIGGGYNGDGGNITIYGGIIEAYAGLWAAGIGGGGSGDGGVTKIYSGIVTAISNGFGAGIGGGDFGLGGTIDISGGTVTATCVGRNGAGIGGGGSGSGGNITISGGTVTASNGYRGAGIGGGDYGSGGNVTISGGTVTASSGSNGTGIGGGYTNYTDGIVTITGGSIKITGDNDGPQPTNGVGTNVYQNTITLGDPPVEDKTAITDGSINGTPCDPSDTPSTGSYGINDVETDATGSVYLWLPPSSVDETVSLTANDTEYSQSYTRASDNSSNTPTILPPYCIKLDITGTHTFTPQDYGYGVQASLIVTVTGTGNNPTGLLDVTLTGTNPMSFTLSGTQISSIATGDIATFTVVPKTGLSAGTYTATVTVSNADVPAASFDVNFTVDKKNITFTGVTATKVYDGNVNFGDTHIDITGATPVGKVGSDDVSIIKTGATGSFGSKDVQSGNITFFGFTISGDDAGNYTLTQPTVAAEITKKNITITGGTVTTKIYDGTTAAAVTVLTFGGLVTGESLTITTDYTVTGALFNTPTAGTGKTVTVANVTLSTVSSSAAYNYNLTTLMPYSDLTGEITKKNIIITGGTVTTKIYDGTTAAAVTGLTFGGLVAGESLTITTNYTVTGALFDTPAAGTGKTVTVANVTLSTVSSSTAYNYNLTTSMPYGGLTGDISPSTLTASNFEYDLSATGYNGLPQGIAAPTLKSPLTGGNITVKYNGSMAIPTNAGSYAVTIDITGSANFTSVIALPLGIYVIEKAGPKPEYLNYHLPKDDIVLYDGLPHSITTAIKAGYESLGVVTVKYNGSKDVPVNPGVYVVTIEFAESANYVAGSFDVGKFIILDPIRPIIPRKVTIEPSLHFDINPSPGSFYIESGKNLTLTLTPRSSLPEGYVPHVTTNRTIYSDDYSGRIKITPNADGTYTVRIAYIIEETVITITAVSPSSGEGSTANEPSAVTPQAWGYGNRLYIRSATPGRAEVYHISGQLLQTLPFAVGETHSQPLPTGLYIVRIDGRSYKVILH